jgi:hypothetical protein
MTTRKADNERKYRNLRIVRTSLLMMTITATLSGCLKGGDGVINASANDVELIVRTLDGRTLRRTVPAKMDLVEHAEYSMPDNRYSRASIWLDGSLAATLNVEEFRARHKVNRKPVLIVVLEGGVYWLPPKWRWSHSMDAVLRHRDEILRFNQSQEHDQHQLSQ